MNTWYQRNVQPFLRHIRTPSTRPGFRFVTSFLFTLSCAAKSVAAQEPAAPLIIEIECSKQNPYVEEALALVFRVGMQVNEAGEEWVQPFTRLLEVPITVEAPWHGNPIGFAWLDEKQEQERAARLVLNGEPYAVSRVGVETRAGHRYEMFEWQRRAVILEAGTFAWPTMEARAVRAKFGLKDFLGEAQVLERREFRAATRPDEFVVRALPLEQRPAAFQNAVGAFELEASIDRQKLSAGESLRLVLRVRGEGNLERLRLPSLRDLDTFHLLGSRAERHALERVGIFDLMPKSSGALTLGPIEFPYFDPRPPGTYRIAVTPRWTIEVGALAATTQQPATKAANRTSTSPWIWGLVIVVTATGLSLLFRRGFRRQKEVDPPLRLAEWLVHRIEKDGVEPGVALGEVLARVLRCQPGTLLSSDLEQRIEAAGASAKIATELSRALRQSVAQRYGSKVAAPSYKDWVPWLNAWQEHSAAAPSCGPLAD